MKIKYSILNILFSAILIAICAAILLPQYARAQTTNPPPASITSGLQEIGNALANSTNWDVVFGLGRSTTGNKDLAFAALDYNINQNVGLVLGYDYLWSPKINSFNSIKGGVSLQVPLRPLAFLGSTFLTNVVVTPFVADLVATPRSGDAIGNILDTGVNFNVYAFKNFMVDSGASYEKRNGQGGFDGAYGLFHLGISRKF